MSGEEDHGDGGSEERLAGTRGEISEAVRRAVGALTDLIGASYLFVVDRSPQEKAVVSVVTFLAGAVAGPVIRRISEILYSLISEIALPSRLLIVFGTLLLDHVIPLGVGAASAYTVYKLNKIELRLDNMAQARTDGGDPDPHHDSPDGPPGGLGEEESLGTGEGAVVGFVFGGLIGVSAGPVWIVVGMIIGAMVGDELEKMGKRSAIAER